jgi:hypothetical protein
MKVKIGKYPNWLGPYQIAEKIPFIQDKTVDAIGEWLSNTWVDTVCKWKIFNQPQKVKVRIDPYDTWSMDTTLAPIILPMLKQLKDTKHGAPRVEDEDVPSHLWDNEEEKQKEHESGETTDNFFERWEWILDEMIWAFDHASNKFDARTYNCEESINQDKRAANGFRLFGKYYQELWD